MIVIKLQGGLGNQLFQYAFGMYLKEKLGKEVKYDTTFFTSPHRFTKRPYALDFFTAEVPIATVQDIQKTKYPLGFVSRIGYLSKKIANKFIFKSYYVGFEEELNRKLSYKHSMYLEGWWQTYKYADAVREFLDKQLRPKRELSVACQVPAEAMTRSDSVFVHIRRGDYLQGGTGLHILSKHYYEQATAYIRKCVPNPSYFIFSDDTAWVKEHMSDIFLGATFVDGSGLSDLESFMLMSTCKHGIIANSSFSWWAAYLIKNPQKIIIAPEDWKNVFITHVNSLCPPSWHRM